MSSKTIPTPSESSMPKGECIICANEASQHCGVCKVTFYCSAECQRTDWKVHKLLCSKLQSFAIRPRPDMRRAIIFGCRKEKPEYTWIKCTKNETGRYDETADINRLFPKGKYVEFCYVNPVRNRILHNSPLKFINKSEGDWRPPISDAEAAALAHVVNKCLYITLSLGTCWRKRDILPVEFVPARVGDIIVMVSNSTYGFSDALPGDLRNAIDYLSVPPKENLNLPATLQQFMESFGPLDALKFSSPDWGARAHKVKAVKVTCIEDEDLQFHPVEFPRDHPFLLDTGKIPPPALKNGRKGMDVPGALGLQLAWFPLPLDPSIERNPNSRKLTEEVADILSCLAPELRTEFHHADRKQVQMVFLRSNLSDLLTEHMVALREFCVEEMLPLLAGPFTKTDYLREATRAAFEAQFETCRQRHGWEQSLPSPFDAQSLGAVISSALKGPQCTCSKSGPLACCHVLSHAYHKEHKADWDETWDLNPKEPETTVSSCEIVRGKHGRRVAYFRGPLPFPRSTPRVGSS